MNRCSGCEKDFTSLSSFDAHRTGSFSKRERRCKSTLEMIESGLEQKQNGRWGLAATADFKAIFQKAK